MDRDWSVASGGTGLRGRVADGVVPQGFPLDLPWPVRWQVQHRFACGRGEAGGHVDQVAAHGGAAGHGVVTAGESARCAQQVMGDHRAGQPGAVRAKQPRWDMSQRPVDQVGEVSTIACLRWVRSASAVGRSELVKNGCYRLCKEPFKPSEN